MDNNGYKKERKGAEPDTYAVNGIFRTSCPTEHERCVASSLPKMDPKMNEKVSESIGKYRKVSGSPYTCDKCNVVCHTNFNYLRHLSTAKHNNGLVEGRPCVKHNCAFCAKSYSYASGLSKHVASKHSSAASETGKKLVEYEHMTAQLLQETNELRQTVIDISKKLHAPSIITHNNSHNNSHNKTFNLNFFLNETCKNAMNISEFIETIRVSLGELERVGEIGFVKGIADIIATKLNGLALTERPIHCSDLKRETLYVKDEDAWAKEVAGNPLMNNLIHHVSHKNLGALGEWRETHPNCNNPMMHESTRYQSLVAAACNGGGDSKSANDSIIKRLAKQVVIGKE